MAKVKVQRTNREELPGVAVLRDALAAELAAFAAARRSSTSTWRSIPTSTT